jgi:cytochrome c oxidase subunit 2
LVSIFERTMGVAELLAVGEQARENLSIFAPASPPAESIRHLFILVLAITGAIFVVVEAALLYSIVRFRAPAPVQTEPAQVYGSNPIEVAWTVTPALIVFLIVLVVIRTEYEVRASPPEPRPGDQALFVTVIGHQWWWEYVYDSFDGKKLDFITANELHIPASERAEDGIKRPAYLTLKSADVCHSYWVPRLAGKTDLIPGRTNHMWFQSDEPGLYLGQCAEYCGTQHANMLLRVYVDPVDQFEGWLQNQRKPAIDRAALRPDRDAFLAQSCINCHRVRGTRAQGTYAPDLTHLMSRETLASGIVPNTREQLQQWVADPGQIKPGCLMPDFGLTDEQVKPIVNYLSSLK